MAEPEPHAVVAHSPIAPAPPVTVQAGWQVSGRRSDAALRLVDCTPLTKVLVRGAEDGAVADAMGVPFGRTARGDGALVVGSGPGEWLLLAKPGTVAVVAQQVPRPAGELVTVCDLSHARALVRVVGPDAARMLAKVCGIDLSDRVTPDGTAFRSSVAGLVTDVVRDDAAGVRSYLLACDRSSGQYLFDALIDAGTEFSVDVDGFAAAGV